MLQADRAYCFAASSPWKLAIFGSTTTRVSMYFSAPGPAGPCRFSGCVSFRERETRILGSSKQVINKDFFSDGISIIMERFKSCLRQTASVNLYNVTNFSLFLSLTVHTSTEKCVVSRQLSLSLKMTTAQYRLSKRQSLSTTTVLFRTTFTLTIKLNLVCIVLFSEKISTWILIWRVPFGKCNSESLQWNTMK